MCRWCEESTTSKKSTALISQIHEAERNFKETQMFLGELRDQQGLILREYGQSHEANDLIKFVRLCGALFPHIVIMLKWQVKLALARNRRSSLHLTMAMRQPGFFFDHLFPIKRPRAQRIVSPPGRKLLRVAEFFFSPKTVTLTFKPLIADWQFEYFEALKNKRGKWHLRMMTLRNYWYYAKACGLSKIAKFFKGFAKQ